MALCIRYDFVDPYIPDNLRIYFTGEDNEIWDSASPYFAGEQSPQFILRLSRELSALDAEREYLLAIAREHRGMDEIEKGLKSARDKVVSREMRYIESKGG